MWMGVALIVGRRGISAQSEQQHVPNGTSSAARPVLACKAEGRCNVRLITATIVTTTLAMTPLVAADTEPIQRLGAAAAVFS
jgi:hypothetical protein